MSATFSIGTPYYGITYVATLDRYGNVYLGGGPTVGKSLTVASGSVAFGWINDGSQLKEQDIKCFASGESLNVSGGFILGGGKTWSGGRSSREFGLFTPLIGVSGTTSKYRGNIWEWVGGTKPQD